MMVPADTAGEAPMAETLLDPTTRVELVRGWMLHCRKARERHTEAARTFEQRRVQFGVVAVIFSAASGAATVGSSAVGQPLLTTAFAVLTLLAAIFAALQSFLDYQGRAAGHQAAATQYKALIWTAEQLLTDELYPDGIPKDEITRFRERLDVVENAAPVVGHGASERIEDRFAGATFEPSLGRRDGATGP
jgi:hypothetical protein